MNLNDLRQQIDVVDTQLIELLMKRMDIVQSIALWKQSQGLPAFDENREQQILNNIIDRARKDMVIPLCEIFSLIFEISRSRQDAILNPQGKETTAPLEPSEV